MNHESDNLMQSLGNQARVLTQARMLPMAKLSEDQIGGVRADFMSYTSRTAVFDAQVAKEVGLSASAISQFRTGQYAGDNEKVARLLNDWMERHARKRKAALPEGYITTGISEQMSTLVQIACSTCSMLAIVAPSGSGKTMVLQVLCEKMRGRLIYCTTDDTPRALLAKIAKAVEVGGGHHGRTAANLMERIVDKLRGTSRPLFFDEAHVLPAGALARIRAIYDQAQVPCVLAGAYAILEHIEADRSTGGGQLASRCLQYNVLDNVLDAARPGSGGGAGGAGAGGGRPLYTKAEIEAFLVGLNVRFQPDALALAWAVACMPSYGCLRTLRRVVLMVRPDQAKRGEPITRREILMALSLLFGSIGAAIGRQAETHMELARQAG